MHDIEKAPLLLIYEEARQRNEREIKPTRGTIKLFNDWQGRFILDNDSEITDFQQYYDDKGKHLASIFYLNEDETERAKVHLGIVDRTVHSINGFYIEPNVFVPPHLDYSKKRSFDNYMVHLTGCPSEEFSLYDKEGNVIFSTNIRSQEYVFNPSKVIHSFLAGSTTSRFLNVWLES